MSAVQLAFDTGAAEPASDGTGLQQPDTANSAFNKLAGVLAYLCAEVARLREHVSLRLHFRLCQAPVSSFPRACV